MEPITWLDDPALGSAVTAATPGVTQDIANSVDARQARLLSLVATFSGGSSPAVTVYPWVWNGTAYVQTGDSYTLNAALPRVELPGGYVWALTGTATGSPSTWAVTAGLGG